MSLLSPLFLSLWMDIGMGIKGGTKKVGGEDGDKEEGGRSEGVRERRMEVGHYLSTLTLWVAARTSVGHSDVTSGLNEMTQALIRLTI